MKRPDRFAISAFATSINFNSTGHNMADLLHLLLPEIITINNDDLFYTQISENNFPFFNFRFPSNNLAWIQHRNVRTTTGRVFIGFCPNLFHIRSWIVHQRMCHTILKCEAEKLLRPHIQSASLHVDIFCIFPDFCRRFLTQYCRLCKYAPNILLDAFFIHRK